jgi:large subunit ribosomal protein L43
MCSRGVYQLRNVKLQYCDWGGSSKGVRDLLTGRELDDFLEKNATISFAAYVRTGSHPCFYTEYISGWSRTIPLANLTSQEILEMLVRARGQFGHAAISQTGPKVITTNPSIQGKWKPNMWGTTVLYEEEKIRDMPEYPVQLKPRKNNPQSKRKYGIEDILKKKVT